MKGVKNQYISNTMYRKVFKTGQEKDWVIKDMLAACPYVPVKKIYAWKILTLQVCAANELIRKRCYA